MKHYASSKFWALYDALPREVREVADKNYELLRTNPRHPSLHFKRIGDFWSVRAGIHQRAIGIDVPDGIMWMWTAAGGIIGGAIDLPSRAVLLAVRDARQAGYPFD